jgi:hypothetical protein
VTPTPLEAALAYAARGWPVFPIWPARGSVCSCPLGAACKRPAKHPLGSLVAKGCDDASVDTTAITAWWTAYPSANIGINLEGAGLVVLDVDVIGKPGAASLEVIDSELTSTLAAKTGSGGAHLVYRRPDGLAAGRKIGFRPGLDLLGRGYILVAPSNHVSGGEYAWLGDDAIAELPAVLANVYAVEASAGLDGPGDHPPASQGLIAHARTLLAGHGPAIEGDGGDGHTYSMGCILMHDLALAPGEAWPLAVEWNATCSPPWSESELAEKLQNGGRYAQGPRGGARSAFEFRSMLAGGTPPPKAETPLPGKPGDWEHELERARREVAALSVPDKIVGAASTRMFEDAKELFARTYPATAWRIKGLMTDAGVGALATEPKSAKTWAATEMAIAVATGTPCFGRFAAARGRVAYFYAEDMAVAIRNRIRSLLKSRGIDPDKLEGLHVQPRGRDLNVMNDESLAVLLASARMIGDLALLVLDPLRDIHDGEEDKSDAMAPVMKRLRFLAHTLGCSVLFVHHAGKATADGAKRRGGQKMRGSSVIHGAVDFGLYLSDLETDGKSTFTNTVESEIKAAKGAGVFGLTLVIEDDEHGQAIRATWSVEDGVEKAKRKSAEAEEKLTAAIVERIGSVECRTITDIRKGPGIGNKPEVTAAIEALEAAGRIRIETCYPKDAPAFKAYRIATPSAPETAADPSSVAGKFMRKG